MTLDEAIAKAKADGDVQLAEWLRQARGADAAAKWYTEKLRDANRTIRKLSDENAKLREAASKLEAENDRLRKLSAEMFKEHKRILAMPKAYRQGMSALYTQMAIWSSECISLRIEVPDA